MVKYKTLLYGYKKFHCSTKNRRYFQQIFLEYKHANQQCVDTFVLDLLILFLKVKVY